MKIFVTGANGYLGQYLCKELISKGYKLTTSTRKPFVVEGASQYISEDYSSPETVQALSGHQVVIHLAARAHQPGRQDAKTYASYRHINVDKTVDLAHASVAAGVKRFIYISSIKVNGEATENRPFTVMDAPSPQDAYGLSKWEAEQKLTEICRANNIELVIIRPPLIWGGVVKGNLATLGKLVNYGIPLPFGAIQNRRDLVSLPNLSSLILSCIEHPLAVNRVFLVSDGVPRTSAQIVQLITSQARFSPRLLNFSPRFLLFCCRIPVVGQKISKLVGSLEVDISETCRLLGWKPDREPGIENQIAERKKIKI